MVPFISMKKRHISRLCIFFKTLLGFFPDKICHSLFKKRQPIWIITFSWHSQRLVPSNMFKRCGIFLLTVPRRCFFCGPFLLFMFVYFVILSCLFLATCAPAWEGLTPLTCNVFVCFCHFTRCCSGSGVILDCIDS